MVGMREAEINTELVAYAYFFLYKELINKC